MSKPAKHRALSLRKKLAFALIPTLILVALVGVAEIVVRCLDLRFADDPYLNLQLARSLFDEQEVAGQRVYRVSHPQAYADRNLTFPVEKPAGGFRIFTLGASASAGWPHKADQTYQRYLEDALRRSFPDEPLEVLDVSGHGFASYRVRMVFDDVIDFDPDLLVIWSGNNEFFEKRSYIGTARNVLEKSHLARLVNVAIRRLVEPDNALSGWGTQKHIGLNDVWSRVERMAQDLRADPAQFEQLIAHYRYSIRHMVATAAERGVRVVLLTVPSNLRDWEPIVSGNQLVGEDLTRWQSALDAGRRALETGDHAAARAEFERAQALAPDDAQVTWLLGRSLDRLGDNAAALEQYRRAKDLDLNPMRAHSECNRAVREIAAEFSNVILLDMEREFAAAADDGLPGFDLFLDYVHPTSRGNLLVARGVHRAIVDHDLVGGVADRRDFETDRVGDYVDAEDVDVTRVLVQLFAMTHQHASARDASKAALELLDRGAGIVRGGEQHRTEFREYFDRAYRVHEVYLRADLDRLFGRPHDPDYVANLQREYREYFFKDIYEDRRKLAAEKQ